MRVRRQLRVVAVWGALVGVACGSKGGGGTTPGPTPTVIAKVSGDSQVAAAGAVLSPYTVVVKDASGNPVANVTVTWAAAAGGGAIAASSVTDASGVATATRTLGAGAGTQTATATRNGLTGSPITFTAFAQIQGATSLQANGGGVAGQTDTVLSTLATPMSVIARNYQNVPVAGVIVSWSGAGGTPSQTLDTTDGAGLSSVNFTFGQTAGAAAVIATVTGLVGSPVNLALTATAANATNLTRNSGNAQAGVINTALANPHTVRVGDGHGNGKPGVTVTWAVGDGGGSVSSTAPVTDAAGIASVTRTLGPSAGTHTDTAKVNGLAGSPVVFSATVTSAPLTANIPVGPGISFGPPSSVTIAAGGSVTFTWAPASASHSIQWLTAPTTLPADSPILTTGTFTPPAGTFNTPGTYTFQCGVHGSLMNGSITVVP